MFSRRKVRCFITILLITLLAGISFVQSFAVTQAPTEPAASPYPTGTYDWELKVIPDINASGPLAFKDFQIQLSYKGDIKHQGKTNQDGYVKFYAIGTLPWDVTISKPGYLTKTYTNSAVSAGSLEEPIEMWAGDINQDNAINMADVIEMAKSFGMTSEDTGFNSVGDFNCDNVINMIDIVTLSKHFNKISSDYSSPIYPPTPTSTYTPTPTTPPTITPSPGQTPTPTGPYPTFHKFPYEVTINMPASDITKDSAIISTDIKVTGSAYISSNTTLVYWIKNNPDNKITKELTLNRDNTNSFSSGITYCTSNSQLTGLEPNTDYCCQIKSSFSPSGEIQTGKYDYYWTHGPYEPYDSIVYEFSTLP